MVVAEDRWRIAATGAQFVFGDLVSTGNVAARGLDLLESASLRERIDVQTRIRAVELRTNSGVATHIYVAKLCLDRDVLLGISGTIEMLGNDADLGGTVRHWNIDNPFTALPVSQ